MLKITWKDIDGLKRFDNVLKALGSGKKVRGKKNRSLNRAGDSARTGVRRAVHKQLGGKKVIKRAVINRAIVSDRSDTFTLTYALKAEGKELSLKRFMPRELRSGVKVNLPTGRVVIQGAFRRGGLWPNRIKSRKLGGNVFLWVRAELTWRCQSQAYLFPMKWGRMRRLAVIFH